MHTQDIKYQLLPQTYTHEEWLQQRQTGIGSSEASIILGLSNYESPYSLWEIKTGRAPLNPSVDPQTEELREWGNRLEPVILDAVCDRLGITAHKPPQAYQSIERPWQHANLDGLTASGEIVEIKTVHWRGADLWRNQIPDHAELQVHHAGAVTGATKAIVAGLIGGNHLEIHRITLNPNIIEIICEAEARFWECVTTDTPPAIDGSQRTLAALTNEWAHKPTPMDIDPSEVEQLWEAWHQAAQARKQAEQAEKHAKAQIAALMDGHTMLTSGEKVWATAKRGVLSKKRLQKDHPDLYAEYLRPVTAFDLEQFKQDHPDLYRDYQAVSITPTQPK